VTGGCGFIGSSLVKQLIEICSSTSIVVLDNFSAGTPEDLSEVTPYLVSSPTKCSAQEGVILVNGDIRDIQTTMDCARSVDCIVHLAANTGVAPSVENPRLDMECNVLGTLNMLEAARMHGVRKFIFASSGAPVGEIEPPIHEEVAPHPVSPYGASKLAGEGYCSAYYRTFGIGTVCLRFGNVYGPRSKKKSSVVAKFIRQAMSGEPCVIYGDGTQTRDFIYIDDLLQAILLSMEREVNGETFQIATGMEHTVGEVAQVISNALNGRGLRMEITHDAPRLGDVKRNYADTRKAEKMLGWRARMSINQGIERTIDYFLNLAAIPGAIEKSND
jgi:UDP-glucose 4-epimerase